MKQAVTFCYSLIVLLMVLSVSFAQKTTQKKDANEALLNQLHPSPVEAPPPMGIKLLAGYADNASTDFEGNKVGQIWKASGVKIRYEIGMSQGHAVDLALKNVYQWSREQNVRGHKVKLALDKENTLLITIPLDDKSSWHAANFYGEIKKPEDLVDMLLMVLTFQP